jgi:hypothetical protein
MATIVSNLLNLIKIHTTTIVRGLPIKRGSPKTGIRHKLVKR